MLELGAQVGDAGVVHAVGNLAERKLAVGEQLLDTLDALRDVAAFDGRAGLLGKELAQHAVFVVQRLGEIFRKVDAQRRIVAVHQTDDLGTDPLGQLAAAIVQPLEAHGPNLKIPLEDFEAPEEGRRPHVISAEVYEEYVQKSQFDALGLQPQPREEVTHDQYAAVAHHVPDVEGPTLLRRSVQGFHTAKITLRRGLCNTPARKIGAQAPPPRSRADRGTTANRRHPPMERRNIHHSPQSDRRPIADCSPAAERQRARLSDNGTPILRQRSSPGAGAPILRQRRPDKGRSAAAGLVLCAACTIFAARNHQPGTVKESLS